MARILGFIGMTVGGAIGWWAGSAVGFMTSFVLGMVGTGVGLYAARRFAEYYGY